MRILTHPRILAPKVLTANGISGLSLIERKGDEIKVSPFAGETFSTIYIPCAVAILQAETFDSEHLTQLITSTPSLTALHSILIAHSLYHHSGPPIIVALSY